MGNDTTLYVSVGGLVLAALSLAVSTGSFVNAQHAKQLARQTALLDRRPAGRDRPGFLRIRQPGLRRCEGPGWRSREERLAIFGTRSWRTRSELGRTEELPLKFGTGARHHTGTPDAAAVLSSATR
jgi:hypothetical protein